MEQNKLLKLLFLAAYIAFASVSCWATAESLHLLLPSWPSYMCWTVTVGFFIVASIGTKLIVDSLNQNIYVEKRGAKFIGGIFLTLVFWLVCSMPTNTHTFFYRNVIDATVSEDITATKGYLDQLFYNTVIENRIRAEQSQLTNKVNLKLIELKTEIKNLANPGFGPVAKKILEDISDLLKANIEEVSYRGTSRKDRDNLIKTYDDRVREQLENSKAKIRESHESTEEKRYKNEAKDHRDNLDKVDKAIKDGRKDGIDVNNAKHIREVNNRLFGAYSTIKRYKQYIEFDPDTSDMERYTAEVPLTKVKQLISVFDVWKGFVKGEYKGHGFIFWVIISILVDISAFIFFDLTFMKRD